MVRVAVARCDSLIRRRSVRRAGLHLRRRQRRQSHRNFARPRSPTSGSSAREYSAPRVRARRIRKLAVTEQVGQWLTQGAFRHLATACYVANKLPLRTDKLCRISLSVNELTLFASLLISSPSASASLRDLSVNKPTAFHVSSLFGKLDAIAGLCGPRGARRRHQPVTTNIQRVSIVLRRSSAAAM